MAAWISVSVYCTIFSLVWKLRLGNVPSFPIFIDLLDEKEEIKRSIYATEPMGVFRFAYLRPNKYYIRVRIDENANGKWDTGHYLKKQKPRSF